MAAAVLSHFLACSGHCIIYVMAPLVFQTYYPGWTAGFLWLAVIRTCVRVRHCVLQHTNHAFPGCVTSFLVVAYICIYTL